MALRAALLALAFAGLIAAAPGASRAAAAPPCPPSAARVAAPDDASRVGGRALLQGGVGVLQELGRPTATPRVVAVAQAQAQTPPPVTLGAASAGALVDRPTGVPRALPAVPERRALGGSRPDEETEQHAAPAPAPAAERRSFASLYEALMETPQLSTLAALVRASGLDVPMLNSTAVRWTLLAPRNAAFEAAEAALGVDARGLQRAVAAQKGRGLLTTHVLDRALTSGALLAARALNASSGVQLTVGGDLARGLRIEAPGSAAAVVVPNVRAGRSVLHILDGVLFPLPAPALAAQLRRAAEAEAKAEAPAPGADREPD